MQDLFSTLTNLVGEFAAEPEAKAPIVFAAWHRTSGRLIRDNAKPVAFDNATLKVAVRDKNWQRQLADHAREYLFKVNSMITGISVERIEFVIQPSAFAASVPGPKDPDRAPQQPSPAVLTAAVSIADKSLREQFLRTAAAAEAQRSKA